ncbi:MAG: hypothetical protein LIO93_00450 [Bacteroidales bacterium]|nr:hypothetical protein [Bacteroidales bacterium]
MLERIVHHLIMHTSIFPELGLYHGKMGIVLFFAHYGRYTGNPLYDEFAGELLDDIFEEMDESVPINFEYGLCGIGWGICYLLQHGFMEGDGDEILYEMDKKIMERDIRRVEDPGIRSGLKGISYYIHKRTQIARQENLPFTPEYLQEWNNRISQEINIPADREILAKIYGAAPIGNLTEWKLGIECGCAGYGLKCIL